MRSWECTGLILRMLCWRAFFFFFFRLQNLLSHIWCQHQTHYHGHLKIHSATFHSCHLVKANKGTYFGLCFYGELKIGLGYGKKKLIFRCRLFILFGWRYLVVVVVVVFCFFIFLLVSSISTQIFCNCTKLTPDILHSSD